MRLQDILTLKRALEGISLTEPEILAYIKKALEEGVDRVREMEISNQEEIVCQLSDH